MKRSFLLVGMALGLLFLFNSCEEDELEEAESELPNEETEGDQRDRFVGNWTVTENSKLLGTRNFVVNIIKDDEFPTRVNLSNFYLIGNSDTVTATISAVLVNTITIQDQTVNASHYSGVGEMVNDQTINLNYFVDDGNANPDTISASFVR